MKEEFSEENIPQSNWMKWPKIGDYIKGTFVKKTFKEGVDQYADQTVYELVNCEGVSDGVKMELTKEDSVLVGISKDFINDRLSKVEEGRRMGVKFIEEIPAKKKGYSPAKSMMPYVWEIDGDYKMKQIEEIMDGEELKVEDIPFK